jgi:hypothetical protein
MHCLLIYSGLICLFADHEILIEEKDDDAAWSVTLAQHLLSKLAVHSNYTISSHSEFALLGEASCLRKEGDRLVVRIGDTSFGMYMY